MTSKELKDRKAALIKQQREFLENKAKDNAAYEKMEAELADCENQIQMYEKLDAREALLEKPTSKPLTGKPESPKNDDGKTGRATDAYRKAFWNQLRTKLYVPELHNALQEGTDSEGGYLVPDEFEHTLVQALKLENVIRNHSHVITTSNGLHKIPVVASHGSAAWMEEEDAYQESDEVFGQVNLDAHKVGTLIKVSEELLQDSAFDLESYISNEFARRIGDKEEDAFLNGNGTHKPTGMLNSTGGAQVGVTAEKTNEIKADELIDLFHSLKAPYRKNAVWILNDATVKLVRKLKDANGQYLWQPALREGEVNTILGRPYYTSAFMPEVAASAKTVIFGDLSYYWIGDRQGISFKRLNELYAGNGQVGFLASKRLDGKTVLPEAIKVLQMHA